MACGRRRRLRERVLIISRPLQTSSPGLWRCLSLLMACGRCLSLLLMACGRCRARRESPSLASGLAEAAHGAGALLAVDGSQYVPHVPTDVPAMGADFLIFTGHKMLGPMGIGVLWARAELLEAMPPFLGGGEMILNVTKEGFTTTEIPWKFEAGTPMVAEAVGLGAAIDYLDNLVNFNSVKLGSNPS